MAEPTRDEAPGDDVLTAYIDSELDADERRAIEARMMSDPALKARLDALGRSGRPYKQAFALVLDAAPRDRLLATLSAMSPRTEPAAPRRFWLSAAAVMLVAIGAGLGFGLRPGPTTTVAVQTPAPTPVPNWRQVVAEYLVLTTPATLAATPDNLALGSTLAEYGAKLKLAVSADQFSLPMTALKDVRLFDYRGRPLVEAAYLSDDASSMVAFCIILNGQPNAPLAFEQREGQNIVFWTSGGHGFMVVGKESLEQLEALARNLQSRFT